MAETKAAPAAAAASPRRTEDDAAKVKHAAAKAVLGNLPSVGHAKEGDGGAKKVQGLMAATAKAKAPLPKSNDDVQAEVERTRKMLAGMKIGKPSADGSAKKNWKAKWKVAAKVVVCAKKFEEGSATGLYKFPSGGRFSPGKKPKTDVDWAIYNARDMPGPGNIPKMARPSGGRFSMSKSRSQLDIEVLRTRDMPDPGAYGDVNKRTISGGKFNMSNPKSDLDWKVHRAKDIPGPGTYNFDLCPVQQGPTFKGVLDRHSERLAKGGGGRPKTSPINQQSGRGTFLRRGQGSGGRAPGSHSASGSLSSSSSSANMNRIRAETRALRAENRALKARVAFAT